MILVSYGKRGQKKVRVGAWIGEPESRGPVAPLPEIPSEGWILDVKSYGRSQGIAVPDGVKEILEQRLLSKLKKLVSTFRTDFRKEKKELRRYVTALRSVVVLPPIPDPGKIICIGKNYRDHCTEGMAEVPKSPVIFPSAQTSSTLFTANAFS